MKTLRERFWEKVEVADGCWEWTASKYTNGYGQISVGGRPVPAHRVAYELSFGRIEPGLHIDHLCRNKGCVRPEHLEAVTCKVNVRRGNARFNGEHNRQKTHCPKGHEYAGDNLIINSKGSRTCAICLRDKRNQWHRDNWPLLRERRAARRQA